MGEVRKHDTWSKETGYIWSMIGSAVGFANVLSFSALCYKNGGGAFLIPYIVAHLIIGLPLLFLEGIIGQRTKLPLVSAMGNVAGIKGKMLGWLAVLTCATIGGFYMVLTGFSVAYTYFAASGSFTADTAHFFKHAFLRDTGSLTHFGGLAFGVLISTLLVAAFAWAVLARNIRSGVEKLCSLFLPMLAVLVIVFSIAAFFLPGSIEGFKQYLIPDFSRLADWALWRDVFGQVFFSLSLGLGIVTAYSRHNPESFSIPRAMVKVAIGDFLISFISGIAIFGCIGFMSGKSGIAFSELVPSDSAFEIGFVIFPMILQQFGDLVSRIVGPIFFFCVFIAGVTGVFSIVESVAGNFEIEFNKSRKVAVGIAMGLVTTLSIPFCFGNGQHIIGAMAPMVLGNAMLLGGISEIILFLMISKVIGNDSLWFSGKRRSYPYYSLKFVVLPLLTISLAGALYQEIAGGFGLAEAVRWTWLLLVLGTGGFLSLRKSPIRIPAGVEDAG
ncbi:MAG: sodium-dependent transporter [Chlamydiales bacterium]|nr:sodium-dependent transporter [Chlamydiales bacterium]